MDKNVSRKDAKPVMELFCALAPLRESLIHQFATSRTMLRLQQISRGVILCVRAHAGARRNAVLGEREGALRVAVTAAPEKGKANRAIIEVLSGALGVSKSAIEMLSGETSPQKRFLIVGGKADEIRDVLQIG